MMSLLVSRPFLLSGLLLMISSSSTEAFTAIQNGHQRQTFATRTTLSLSDTPEATSTTSRRDLLQGIVATTFGGVMTAAVSMPPTAALAAAAGAVDEGTNVPMLSLDEFLVILRDSAKSIQRVEFSGPQAETVRVRLIDGTVFGLSDIIESPTDPRSPLKVQAACREYKGTFCCNNTLFGFCYCFFSVVAWNVCTVGKIQGM